jgi:glycogen synthase
MNEHCLILTSEAGPLVLGGVGRYVAEVSKRLRAEMRVTVLLVPTYGRSDAAHVAPGIEFAGTAFQQALVNESAGSFADCLRAAVDVGEQASAVFASGETPIVYVQEYALAPIAAALRRRLPQARVLAACHLPVFAGFTYFDKPVHDSMHQVLESKLVQLADRVIVPSAFAGFVLGLTHNVPSDKLSVIPLGVERPVPVVPTPPGPLRLLAVGRATEQKGQHFLFLALANLQRRHKGLRLTLAGGGAGTPRLQALAELHGVTAFVDHVPSVAHDAIWDLLDRHHLLVSTSLYETFGLAPLEAMASGRPTPGFALEALHELWGDAYCARVGVPIADVGALVDRVDELAGCDERYYAAAHQAMKRAAGFRWELHVRRLTEAMRCR